MSDELSDLFNHDPLEGFGGVGRLFPLPNLVLFPDVLVALHVFEPRYRQMVADAMGSDRLITMVLLKPGYEASYAGCPAIHSVGCLGQIVRHEPLPDGRSNLILRGLRRVRVDSETPSDRLYRVARLTILDGPHAAGGVGGPAPELGRAIFGSLAELLAAVGRSADAERIRSAGDMPAGKLCDLAAHAIGFDASVKQALLEELDVERRAEILAAWMRATLESCRRRQSGDARCVDFSPN